MSASNEPACDFPAPEPLVCLGVGPVKACGLTRRAPDKWESARFRGSFLASRFFCSHTESTPAHLQVTLAVSPNPRKSRKYMTTDADKLIYENANKYRLHADSIRWTLLGGYVAFFPALFGLAKSDSTATAISKPEITLLIALLSLAYLWILSFQNWLYNRYSGW